MTEAPFLGYGTPEALETAIKSGEGKHLVVYREGLFNTSVCSDLAQEEVVARMARRISGTTNGWTLSTNDHFATGQPNPCPCDKNPETHTHYLFDA